LRKIWRLFHNTRALVAYSSGMWAVKLYKVLQFLTGGDGSHSLTVVVVVTIISLQLRAWSLTFGK